MATNLHEHGFLVDIIKFIIKIKKEGATLIGWRRRHQMRDRVIAWHPFLTPMPSCKGGRWDATPRREAVVRHFETS